MLGLVFVNKDAGLIFRTRPTLTFGDNIVGLTLTVEDNGEPNNLRVVVSQVPQVCGQFVFAPYCP
jgi:hypothetical protein